MNPNEKLAPNFALHEFLNPNDPSPPGPEALANLRILANRLQGIRDILNRPIRITSGFRSKAYNEMLRRTLGPKRVAKDSAHIEGKAADIEIQGMTPEQTQAFLKNWSGGLGSYTTHTHVDIGERRRW